MNVITGHCGKCGAPYTQPQVWHGIGTPPITPSCACLNYMPITISTGSGYPIYKEELQPQKSEEQSDSPASPVQQTQPGNSLSNELGIVIAAGCDNVEIYNDVMKNVNAVLANFGLA